MSDQVKKLLVIDDDIDIVGLLQTVLEFHGFDVEVANDPEKGMKLVQENSYDLLMSDYLMDPIDGLEVISKVRETNLDLKVILLTGKDLNEREMARVASLNAIYLKKPFSVDELVQKVEGILAADDALDSAHS